MVAGVRMDQNGAGMGVRRVCSSKVDFLPSIIRPVRDSGGRGGKGKGGKRTEEMKGQKLGLETWEGEIRYPHPTTHSGVRKGFS